MDFPVWRSRKSRRSLAVTDRGMFETRTVAVSLCSTAIFEEKDDNRRSAAGGFRGVFGVLFFQRNSKKGK